MPDLKNIMSILKGIDSKVNEIRQLYDLSESDVELLTHMMYVITNLGWSRKLTIKLAKAATAVLEMTESDVKDLSNELNKK